MKRPRPVPSSLPRTSNKEARVDKEDADQPIPEPHAKLLVPTQLTRGRPNVVLQPRSL